MMRDDDILKEFRADLASLGRTVRRAVVLVHVPKTAGIALAETSEAAGWGLLDLDHLIRRRSGCPQCGGTCDVGLRWRPGSIDRRAPGLLVTVGHRPLDLGLEAAGLLAAAGAETRIVLMVRDPTERLESMFRYYWRNAMAGGLERLVRSAGHGRRRLAALVVARAAPTRCRRLLGATHRSRTDRGYALDGLHYATAGSDGPVIDGRRWLHSFAMNGPGVPYWLDEFVGTPARLRALREAGRVRVVSTSGLDAFAMSTFGRPSVHANVSSDAPHPAVVAALRAIQEDLVRVAARDDAFRILIAEAAA